MDLLDQLPQMIGETVYEGLVKVKLVHAEGFSVLLPDLLIIGSKWYQARFFTAPTLSWLDEGACCQFSFELDVNIKLFVRFTRDRLISHLPDGSSIYRCRIGGPANVEQRADGECEVGANGSIALWLYHHTEPETVDAIRASSHFRASDWNIQGTQKKLANVRYVYFTSLSRITTDTDLERIAMASKGLIALIPTNSPKDIVFLRVYRESTFNRRASLRVLVPCDSLASQHVYYQAPHGNAVYYEMCHPQIFRVGLLPGNVLPLAGERIVPNEASLKRFNYVVLGHADTRIGLRAPYDEENTPAIFKIDRLSPSTDIFDLWRQHANTDRFNGYAIEMASFRRA